MTHYDIIKQRFHDVGIELTGKPFSVPKIIYWNLRSDTHGYPERSETPNVQLLSGFSPNLFKYVLSGQNMLDFPTPYSTLRCILDDDRYNIIREIVYLCGEIAVNIKNLNI